jgi:hypothetical protein
MPAACAGCSSASYSGLPEPHLLIGWFGTEAATLYSKQLQRRFIVNFCKCSNAWVLLSWLPCQGARWPARGLHGVQAARWQHM